MKITIKIKITIYRPVIKDIAMMRLHMAIPMVPTIKMGLLPKFPVKNRTESRSPRNCTLLRMRAMYIARPALNCLIIYPENVMRQFPPINCLNIIT